MSAQKRRVEAVLRRYRALLVLAGGLTPDHRKELERDLAAISSLTTKPLRELEAAAAAGIEELSRTLGLLMPLDQCVEVVEDAIRQPYDLLFAPKHFIDRTLFANMGAVSPRWELFPPHTRFGIDAKGLQPFTGREIEWRLLEAAVFEDMAMLWNEALAAEVDDRGKTRHERIPGKKFRVLKRATVKAAFSLLEAYLNGIAVDVLHTDDRATLSKGALEALEERDQDGRFRPKSLREKVLTYPRVAVGAEHPLSDENNADDLRFVLEKERQLRDAIVHPTPRFEENRTECREQAFFEIDLPELAKLIDNVISLIRRIDAVLDGRFGRVELWIRDRGVDGRFPDETFY